MNPVDQLMEKGVRDGVFPGAALLLSRGGDILHRAIYGNAALEPERVGMRFGTLFDVASLSKVMATTAIAMRLQEAGRLELDVELASLLPVFKESAYRAVTVEHLLAHTAGLPAYVPYFQRFGVTEVEDLPRDEVQARLLEWIAQETPLGAAGAERVYSDLDFIILGALLEKVGGESLRDLFRREVAAPLELHQTLYSPVDRSRREAGRVAATEKDPWRGRLLCGEVDDQNAYLLGGVAGHAGIFTSVDDCHKFACELLRSVRGDSSWLRAETVGLFIGSDRRRTLGWDRPSQPTSQAGRYIHASAWGHLGFTGCSLWIEPDRELIVILFSNRVHPTRSNDLIKAFRPLIHDAVFQHYVGADDESAK